MLCRLCLKDSDCCLEIFDVNGEQLEIAKILKRHFWFQPVPNDTISTVICRICWLKVSDFHQFYLAIEQAQSSLSDTCVKLETVTVTEQDFTQQSVQIKEECLEFLRINEKVEESVNPLYEAELEHSMNEDSEEDEIKTKEIKNESNAVNITEKTPRQKRKYVRRTQSKKRLGKSKLDEDEEDSEDDDDDDEQEKPKRQKVITSTPQDDAMVKKHIPMGCELCTFVGEDFTAMAKHFRLQHPMIKPYIRCCNKKLNKRFKVVQHAYKHEDPDFFKCQDCQKVFSDRYTLKSHMIAAHAPEEELNFACDQCPKKFSRKHLLELHRPSHVPMDERSFICDQCPNSRFASNHLLKIHISMRHRRATNVCHVCAKEMRDKASFEKHVRSHFDDGGPKVKCTLDGCDRWLKDEDNLRRHIRRLHTKDQKAVTCETCGRECKNQDALTRHKYRVHSNIVFTCEECKKTFKRAIHLREHMAQHTGEILYKCPFCTRTSNSNANMHSHKKKMHPLEWENWKKTNNGSSQQILSNQQENTQNLYSLYNN
uniref:Transcription factor grauzone n=1 Tax=Bactrocera dorsalis TaxID=27457 RepID=A0A034VVM0_BACDO